ncbi:unnamed protein product, partial [Didymodactylos carnosus]
TYVSLDDPGDTATTEEKQFEATLVCVNPNTEKNIDLLRLPGNKQQINLYVTAVIDELFTKKELCNLEPRKIASDERYQRIQEAVRSKFKLSEETMNIEWPHLHTVILQKRRDTKKSLENSKKEA